MKMGVLGVAAGGSHPRRPPQSWLGVAREPSQSKEWLTEVKKLNGKIKK